MRLLLDTHALLWFCGGSESLSPSAREAIEDEGNTCFVSQISAWEVAIKASLKKLTLHAAFDELFPGALLANGWHQVEPHFDHYSALLSLPHHHRDPFDRLLIAQAKVEGLTIVTRDPHFAGYGVPLLW